MNSSRHRKSYRPLLGATIFISLVVAWIVGTNTAQDEVTRYLDIALPQADSFEDVGEGMYAAYRHGSANELIGYIAVGEAVGYGGPMKIAVATDLHGNITGLAIVDQKETPSFLRRLQDRDYLETFLGKSYQDPFQLGEDVDAISGATYTSRAVAEASLRASRTIAETRLGLRPPREMTPVIQFGFPEITLIGLYAAGFVGHRRGFKHTRLVRWISMLVGLVVLGFLYTRPLTLSDVSRLLLGFWPQWQTNLYWYFLLGGILFVFTVDNKNPYCEWFCPFGAAQEGLGAIGGAKARSPGRYRNILLWIQRGLAWLAILMALLFRDPGLTSYEIFGTFFDLQGTAAQFALLGIVLTASLFVRRPWCNYLCPLRPVTDFYRELRKWVHESWLTIKKKQTGS